ncbi:hypothetical protein [Saccharopolyspora hattusasensis]|uniref:hypothetical protein n=1 Tax=Saccharopolyspora hattusasensis TaxID=1128679 RepID=UPI003D9853AD
MSVTPEARKPWMKRRSGETVEQYHARLSHTCYACGEQYADLTVLNLHEDTHTAKGSRALSAT